MRRGDGACGAACTIRCICSWLISCCWTCIWRLISCISDFISATCVFKLWTSSLFSAVVAVAGAAAALAVVDAGGFRAPRLAKEEARAEDMDDTFSSSLRAPDMSM
jgi:hypothetical protein